MSDEKNIPAQYPPSQEDSRLSCPNENQRREESSQKATPEGPQASGGLMDEGLRPRERLKKKKDFLFLYQKGHRIKGKYFNVIYHENKLGYSRLGIVVSRKIGKAVLRNKIKRWVRELFRRNKQLLPFPMDLLIVATQGIENITWDEYRQEYFRTLHRIAQREKQN